MQATEQRTRDAESGLAKLQSEAKQLAEHQQREAALQRQMQEARAETQQHKAAAVQCQEQLLAEQRRCEDLESQLLMQVS